MEVKVDPTLYFSNASQSGNEIEQDSQDGQDSLTVDSSVNSNSNSENGLIINTKMQNLSESEKKETDKWLVNETALINNFFHFILFC